MATFGPASTGWVASTLAVSSSPATVGTSISPACWYSALPDGSIAAAPVRTATIGRCRETRRAIRANFRGLPKDSVYIAITRVVSSSSQNCRRSLPEMSLLSPSETNHDKPIASRSAWRSREAPSEPDCSEIAIAPGGRVTGTSDACSPISARDAATPMLPGPMMRIP